MEEHEFPLDSDADLRKHVKLEIEHETAQLKMNKMRERFLSLGRRSLLSFVLAIGFYKLMNPKLSIVGVAIYTIGFCLFFNFKTIYNIISSWRDMMSARNDLNSWNAVKADYNKEIAREGNVAQDKAEIP